MSDYTIYGESLLNKRIFRLLFILPAPNQRQQLECCCLPFNIDDAPPYEALSYAWGESKSSAEIRCNGKPVTIGLELSRVLTQLRSPETTRIIWADALCINQSDNVEKSHQVPLMGSIYSLAKRVIVWLGQGDEDHIIEAFECSRYIADACLRYDKERGLLPDHVRHEALSLPEDIFHSSTWKSLQKLYERPWFSRVWCVQEIRLARDAFVLWGNHVIDWLDLSLAASWVFDKWAVRAADIKIPFDVGQHVSRPDILRDKSRYSLLRALQTFRRFHSTDPRDKVYGLLNLINNQSEVNALVLNYDKSVGEVYADTVLATVRVHSRLSTLAFITHPHDYDPDDEENSKFQCRSWAPRWDDWAVTDVWTFPEHYCRWKPCGDNETVVVADHDSQAKELCLKGVFYNRVCEVGDIMDYYNLKDPVFNGTRPEDGDMDMDMDIDSRSDYPHPLLDLFNRVFAASSSNTMHKAWARTLTAGRWNKPPYYIENLDSVILESYYHAYHRFMHRLKELQVTGTEGDFAHNEHSAIFENVVYDACVRRRIFWVENMAFGLGPQCMQPGDIVVVLYGGKTPYILRPRGDKYLFMGEAYVDNIMHGEMFNGSEEYQERTFCLI